MDSHCKLIKEFTQDLGREDLFMKKYEINWLYMI
jgi:hypothetical protein